MSITLNPFEKLKSLKKMTITDENKLRSLYKDLLEMDMSSKEKVLEFQKKRDLIEKYNVNEMAESYFLMTTDVADEEKKKRQEHFDQVISPIIREYEEQLNKKFLGSEIGQELEAPYDILRRNQKNEIDIFCKKNIELNKKIDKLSMEITEIQGKLTANWKGEDIPLPDLYPYLKSADRQLRKEAYECLNSVELKY